MINGTCKTCQHWLPYSGNVNIRQCQSPKLIFGYGIQPCPLDGALVEDDEGWGFLPGPDFGCVNYVPLAKVVTAP